MPVLTWPSALAPSDMEWSQASNTQGYFSPLSGVGVTTELPGSKWQAAFTFELLSDAQVAPLQAFLVRLRGRAGRFYMHNFARPIPRGTIAGAPLVKGAGQGGNTLSIDGCTPGTTLLEGDFIGVNGELKMVVIDTTADGIGEMLITLEPPLRSSPADNAPITTVMPTAKMMLTEDSYKVLTKPGNDNTLAVTCLENWT